MALLGTPDGNLLSAVMDNAFNEVVPDPIMGTFTINVNIDFLGWVTENNRTSVRLKMSGARSVLLSSIATGYTFVRFTFVNNANGSRVTVEESINRFGDILIWSQSFTSRLESIYIYSRAKHEGQIEGKTVVTATAIHETTYTLSYCTSPYVLVNSSSEPKKHIYLPTNALSGYTIHIKNVNKQSVYVHAHTRPIEDGTNSRIFASTTVVDSDTGVSNSGSECGFIMPQNAACTLLYDCSRWLINEYYSGQRSGFLNALSGSLSPSSITPVTGPILLANIAAGSKYVSLPDPSGPCRKITLISYGSATNNLFFTTGGSGRSIDLVSYDSNPWWYLRPDKAQANAAITLLSNGVNGWHIMSCTDAVSLYWDSVVDDRTPFSSTHVTLTQGTNDGVGITPTNIPPTGGAVYYVKHGALCTYANGIVVSTKYGVGLGGTSSLRTFLGAQRNRSAAAVLATKVGSTPMCFLLSSFVGL